MSKKSEAEKRRQAFEAAIRSLMFAPKIYGSHPDGPNPLIAMLDSAIEDSGSVKHIKMLLKLKAERITEEETKKAADRERDRIRLRPDEMDVIVNIALDLLSGHDPRQLLAIKPVRGPRRSADKEQCEMDIATLAHRNTSRCWRFKDARRT